MRGTPQGAVCWQRFRHPKGIVEYPTRVRWKCTRCAECCQDTSSHERRIRVLPQEISKITLKTGLRAGQFSTSYPYPPYTREMRKVSGRCFFLRRGLCSIYEVRPVTCVFYPFFLDHLREGGYRFGLTSERCKGLGLGRELTETKFRRLFSLAMLKLSQSQEKT
jgi:Fe-S-cluster containining protein